MSGQRELVSPYIRSKLEESRQKYGSGSEVVRVLERQYLRDPREDEIFEDERERHYEADVHLTYMGKQLRGVEKLYRRVIVIQPTTACAAHCRFCLRRLYPTIHLSEDELLATAKYCGDESVNGEVNEVLISGGDPFIIPDKLELLIDLIVEHAPNIKNIRIGSRVPVQAPEKIDDTLLHALRERENIWLELATHVNHASELFPEVREAYRKLRDTGMTLYNQAVLLRGVNDNISALINLHDELRYIGIETHYLFHAIPMKGTHHHRVSLEKGLRLIRELTSCGAISGRCKPMFTVMTDIGKITLYDGVILEKNKKHILLQSYYSYKDRKKWNPHWQKPDSVIIDDEGYMRVWYLNGSD